MLLVALITALVGSVFSQLHFTNEDPVINPISVLTEANFTSFLKEHPAVIGIFCTPWSIQCKDLKPTMKKMSTHEYHVPLQIVTVDTSTEISLALRYKIRKHPTIIYFQTAQATTYTGKEIDYEINRWVRKVSHPPVNWVETSEKLNEVGEEFLAYLLILNEENAELTKIYEEVAARHQHVLFYITKMEEAKARLWSPEAFSLVAFRRFDDGRRSITSKNPFTKSEIERFINETGAPVVLEMTEETLDSTIRQRQNSAVCIYTSENSPLLQIFEKLAPERIADVHYLKFRGYGHGSEKVRTALEARDQPDALRIVEYLEEGDKVYHFVKPLTEENVRQFLTDFSVGNLTNWQRSEEPFFNETGPLFYLVAREFEEKVFDETKDVFVLYVTEHCKNCDAVRHSLDYFLAHHNLPETVKFYMMNVSANDHPLIPSARFPNIFGYIRRRKEHPIPYSDELNEVNFRDFLESHTHVRFNRSGKLDDVEDSL
jgi:protein disulfide-isomerase A1